MLFGSKMASQIEIVSSAPFGCVLKDRNQRERCRDDNARATFEKNLQNLVRGHFTTSISFSSTNIENLDCENLEFMNTSFDKNSNDDESLVNMSPGQARILDRWAARQAREVVSTIERQSREAEIQALSGSQAVSSRTSSFLRDTSPSPSDTSVEIPNLGGASSLVQMWEARLNRSNSLNSNSPVGISSSRTNSGLSCPDNACFVIENAKKCEFGYEESSRPITGFKKIESADDESSRTVKKQKSCESVNAKSSKNIEIVKKMEPRNEESSRTTTDFKQIESADEESSRTVKKPKNCESTNAKSSRNLKYVENHGMNEDSSGDSESEARDSDSGENDRVRVSDMVKRLTLVNDNQNEQPSTGRASEQHISLPRIRARWSVLDQAENKISSTFIRRSPRIRGRQAFNDFFMQMERDRHMELSNLVERRVVSGFQQGSHIQSIIRRGVLQGEVAVKESTITIPRERFNTTIEQGGLSTRNDEAGNLEIQVTDLGILNNYAHNFEISSPSSQLSEDSRHQEEQAAASSRRSSVTCASGVFHEEASQSSDVTWQEATFEARNLDAEAIEENSYWDENATEYEQDSYNNQHFYDSSFRDISRPRIHWEDRRQERYQEMLDSDSENVEIRQLLERRRVSTFLSSDFRHTIDQLMVSRLNLPTQPSENQDEELGSQVRRDQLIISFFDRQEEVEEENEDGEEEEVDEENDTVYEDEEVEERTIGHRYHEVNDYFDQTPSSSINLPLPSPYSSWNSYRDQEMGNDSYQVASTSLRQPHPLSSLSYYHDTREGSSSMNNRSSFEMELIYDMRAQMEQLRQEMVELRNSINSCTDMQAQMHHPFKQEDHTVQGVGKTPLLNKAPRQGNCCICYEMKVDSLLYRCGHMCTCIKCAHELQSSSGKCPICRAPILDVVRAFTDS